ncbi:hypothetical protein DFH08DRAFT_937394 [Mycena albidolilacea]|uniref:Uncharacterized protein n=1 Tax=Mycena albidolilacea TaxID=1033008 RepID=A0AAD7A0K8_9AGAR|nr:hypothetical protein DFH08DRAFT_937394 [Mycena albidolilacea]
MDDMRPRNIGPTHWQDRVGAAGRVMLYLLAIQYELGEVFELSCQTLLDILNGFISPLNQDWCNVFFFMYLATDPEELRHKDTFNMNTFTANRNSFYSEHVIYDPTIRLPNFEPLYPSRNTGMTPISITVTDAADAEFHGKKKGNNKQAESLRPAKQNRKIENGGGGGGGHEKDKRQRTKFALFIDSYQIKRSKQQTLTADPERVESEQELEVHELNIVTVIREYHEVKRCDRICRDMDAVLEISGAVEQYRFGCGDAVKR